MEGQEARLTEVFLGRLEKSETSLLLAFRKWAVKSDGKFKVHDLLLSTAEERLDMLEHRLDDLEQRGNA
jgi:hypothetical protein